MTARQRDLFFHYFVAPMVAIGIVAAIIEVLFIAASLDVGMDTLGALLDWFGSGIHRSCGGKTLAWACVEWTTAFVVLLAPGGALALAMVLYAARKG